MHGRGKVIAKKALTNVDFFDYLVGRKNRHQGQDRQVTVALVEAANATSYHCSNAAGTFSYQHSRWALRQEFVEGEWTLDRCDGVEAIWNEDRKIRVIFSNVDIACDDEQPPKPRSRKGAGAERACIGNLSSAIASVRASSFGRRCNVLPDGR